MRIVALSEYVLAKKIRSNVMYQFHWKWFAQQNADKLSVGGRAASLCSLLCVSQDNEHEEANVSRKVAF
jgi:hypothetical protein